MEITFNFGLEIYKVDLDKPMDLSISLKGGLRSAWYSILRLLKKRTYQVSNLRQDGGSTNFNHISTLMLM